MTNEQEIERMVNVYENARILARGTAGSMNRGEADWYCRCLHNAGIGDKKQAVKEFIEKLFEMSGIVMTVADTKVKAVLCSKINKLFTELYGEEE